jgi:predicted transglutaminase-like cysteine proteinase
MPSQDARNMYAALQQAFRAFLEEYTRLKGTDEVSDVELKAAGNGFRDIANGVIDEQNKKLAGGNTEGHAHPAKVTQSGKASLYLRSLPISSMLGQGLFFSSKGIPTTSPAPILRQQSIINPPSQSFPMNDSGSCPFQTANSTKGQVPYQAFITPGEVAEVAWDIVKTYTENGSLCGPIKQIVHWVTKHIRYVTDIQNFGVPDYWLFPVETLELGSEDCDGLSLLTCSMLEAVGVPARCVMGQTPFGYHMWVEASDPVTGDWYLIECTRGRIYDWEARQKLRYYPDIYFNEYGCSLPEGSMKTELPDYGQ